MNPYPISKFPSRWSPGCLNWGVKGDNLPPTHTHKAKRKIQELVKNGQLVDEIWLLFVLLLVKFLF